MEKHTTSFIRSHHLKQILEDYQVLRSVLLLFLKRAKTANEKKFTILAQIL